MYAVRQIRFGTPRTTSQRIGLLLPHRHKTQGFRMRGWFGLARLFIDRRCWNDWLVGSDNDRRCLVKCRADTIGMGSEFHSSIKFQSCQKRFLRRWLLHLFYFAWTEGDVTIIGFLAERSFTCRAAWKKRRVELKRKSLGTIHPWTCARPTKHDANEVTAKKSKCVFRWVSMLSTLYISERVLSLVIKGNVSRSLEHDCSRTRSRSITTTWNHRLKLLRRKVSTKKCVPLESCLPLIHSFDKMYRHSSEVRHESTQLESDLRYW